ncbi:MAG TPA: response regulator transcription factor [Terracidiphilus sp.]|jgi:DNA-binding NarL/FixJ family response regulator|nr:response regulator transcription factor [Terracidiphilus sp.]
MENHHRPRILIADDHRLIAEACKNLLEPEFKVVAMVSDGRELLKAEAELRPDVVILDISMPRLNGLDAGEVIKQRNRSIKLIYLTMSLAADVAAEAFRRGASAYVLKQCSAEELITAVRRVMRGQSYLSPLITKDTVEYLLRSGAVYREEKHITTRQSEVLQLLAEGKSMKEVAFILQLKPGTVAFHKYRIMDILGIKTSAGLIEYAIRHHMISPQ